ncbi:MAG: LysM peptidoglycan-binding domain-containing protein [Campylobacterales bacterium]|nr:LysM peptidoglycan-binding domain-containing protein [Campylobacterales bacterium]
MRIVLLLLLLMCGAHAVLTFENNNRRESVVLKSFDISPEFLADRVLRQTIAHYKSTYAHEHFFKAMDDAYIYIPMIKEVLSRSALPAEFIFLAMAESNFSLKAFSDKRASGLWQFISETAQYNGLRIDNYVDERRDLVKSTEAAVRYLEALHAKFGKWYLAALAYNCGEGRLRRAIELAQSDDLSVLVDSQKRYLPKETRLYIRKILALALIGNDENYLIAHEYDFLLNRASAFSIAPVEIAGGERLSRVAKVLRLPIKELERYNRHLKYDFVPPEEKGYTIYIPYAKLADFKRDYKSEPLRDVYMVHTVKKGETLAKIGRQYKIDYRKIVDFNHLSGTILSLGQRLIIPVDKPAQERESKYIVRAGDTLASIAKHFDLTIAKLKAMNNLKDSLIRIGDRLHVYD